MSNLIQFWLKDREDLYLRLPVNPSEISVSSPFGISKINVVGMGEVTIPGERGLKSVSFESFFPRDYNASYCEYRDFPKPREWVEQIEKWRDTRKNIRLIVSGTDISIPVFVEEFEVTTERAGHPGDIFYSISLIEYRAPIVRKVEKKAEVAKVAAASRPTAAKAVAKTYIVKKGDSLSIIAKRIYGSGSEYPKIYDANKAVIGKNPNLILPGQKLVIP